MYWEEWLKDYPGQEDKVENAKNAIDFISELKHTKGKQWKGKQWQWIPWQKDLIVELFGTLDENGHRQYRTCFVEIPKKNGKSEIGATIALYLLAADDEFGAEIYSAAADTYQASIVFDIAASMVNQNKILNKTLKVLHSTKRIVYYEKNSLYRALSSDAYTKQGYHIHGCVFDEIHNQPNRDLWDVLKDGAGDARLQPLMFVITTAGIKDEKSIGWEVHEYARKVKEGIIEDSHYLPILYGLPEDEDWEDEENWKKVNPSLGYTITIDKLRDAYNEARHIPAKQNTFRRLRLNQWTSQGVRWLPMNFWDKCDIPVDRDLLKGRECYGGLDLASKVDIAAFVLMFPDENGFFDILPFFWIPEENMIQRSKNDGVPYDVWVRQGYITATPGNVIDYDYIENEIIELGHEFHVMDIGYDEWGAVQIAQHLEKEDFTITTFRQGMKSMSPPTKDLLTLTMGLKLRHGGNPVLRWMADNLTVKSDAAENYKPDKEKSTERIDGIVALIMGLDRAIRQEDTESIYSERGIITIGGEEGKESEESTEEEIEQIKLNTECPRCKRPTRLQPSSDGRLYCLSCGGIIDKK